MDELALAQTHRCTPQIDRQRIFVKTPLPSGFGTNYLYKETILEFYSSRRLKKIKFFNMSMTDYYEGFLNNWLLDR